MSQLADFQIHLCPGGLSAQEQQRGNMSAFPIFEAVRLWLSDHPVSAPYRKLLVSIASSDSGHRRSSVIVALSICEIFVVVDGVTLRDNLGSLVWLCDVAQHAVEQAATATMWDAKDIVLLISNVAVSKPACSYRLRRLSRTSGKTGVSCDTWFEADVGESCVRVRFSFPNGSVADTVVLHKSGPLYLEDDFPVRSAVVRGDQYVLLAKDRTPLATLTVPDAPR